MTNFTSLIDAAKVILDNRFDAQRFLSWQSLAFMTLRNLLGPFHYYTQNFKLLTSETNELSLLIGDGILIAAREMTTPQVQAI
ncbi:MAG: hypothetical protein ACLP5H_14560 [Desulfomonilaceae bacterium]